jgi:hypothetical protein
MVTGVTVTCWRRMKLFSIFIYKCAFVLSYKYKTLTSGYLSIPKLHRKELQVILRTLPVNNFDFFNVSGGRI